LRGSLPKVGIRPTIDGRYGGVRESLEEPTMQMAQLVKTLLESELRHASGLPVEVVIADTCIGGASEAALCAEKFAREGVGVSLTVTPCWCYGSETIDMTPHIPKAIWGLTARRVRARFISRRLWRLIRKKAFPPSASTATTCRTWATTRSPMTCAKRFCVLCAPV
jgi:hypothetical protein